ncbi:hypothetical protein KQX54_003307 [Cotesia glomerata]|uniref:Uncharacterized protein n=1 Tax=Cotesia glomerata TaxID=32391 RepID=A0AAV7I567_COTGL|nr:hypothetical protein KQX54_003307 [Cotesia glomerata]
MAKSIEIPNKEIVKALEKKLEKCRNQENNHDSEMYKKKMQEMLDEEDLLDDDRYAKIVKDQAANDEKILGVDRIN